MNGPGPEPRPKICAGPGSGQGARGPGQGAQAQGARPGTKGPGLGPMWAPGPGPVRARLGRKFWAWVRARAHTFPCSSIPFLCIPCAVASIPFQYIGNRDSGGKARNQLFLPTLSLTVSAWASRALGPHGSHVDPNWAPYMAPWGPGPCGPSGPRPLLREIQRMDSIKQHVGLWLVTKT